MVKLASGWPLATSLLLYQSNCQKINFVLQMFSPLVGGVSSLDKVEVVTAEEVEGVAEGEGAEVVVLKEQMLPQRILMQN